MSKRKILGVCMLIGLVPLIISMRYVPRDADTFFWMLSGFAVFWWVVIIVVDRMSQKDGGDW